MVAGRDLWPTEKTAVREQLIGMEPCDPPAVGHRVVGCVSASHATADPVPASTGSLADRESSENCFSPVISNGREIGGDFTDLLSSEIFRILVHDLVGASHGRERFQLTGEIGLVLSGQTRYRTVALCLLAVAAHAGGRTLGRNTFSVDLRTRGGFRCSAGCAGNRSLGRIVGSDGIDVLICSASAPMRQQGQVEIERISGPS